MAQLSTVQRIVLASNNAKKIQELQQLLQPLGFDVLPQSTFDLPSVDETGLTFIENAILKARHAAQASGLPAIADDSGLEVDALHGAPGIYSARFAGEHATDAQNNALLLEKLHGIADTQRTARYQCVVVFLQHAQAPTPIVCSAHWEGRILHEPCGTGGFGYDPLFFVPTHRCSAAELAAVDKNRISHRGQAMQQLVQTLRNAHTLHNQ